MGLATTGNWTNFFIVFANNHRAFQYFADRPFCVCQLVVAEILKTHYKYPARVTTFFKNGVIHTYFG